MTQELTEEQRDKEYKRLKGKLSKEKKRYEELQFKINELEKQQPDIKDLERQLSELSHNYRCGQLVVLKEVNDIAKIEGLVGRKHYKVFVQCQGLRTGLGIAKKIHERDILCRVERLRLNDCKWDISGLPQDKRSDTHFPKSDN